VAYGVTKYKKTRSIIEEQFFFAAVDTVNIMVGEYAGRLLSKLPVHNNTIRRRIQRMAEDLNDQ
jgi:putative Mn2+ efflux pump MntP